jgi:hypothetical protein
MPKGIRLSLADYEDGRSRRCAAPISSKPRHLRRPAPSIPGSLSACLITLAETPVSHVGPSVNFLSQALPAFALIGLCAAPPRGFGLCWAAGW